MRFGTGRLRRGAGLAALMRATTIIGLAAGAAALAPLPALSQSYQVSQVQVRGNQRVDTSTVVGYLQLPPGQVSAGELNGAYQRLVQTGLFESVDLAPQGGTLVVTVQEWPTVGQISIEGNARLGDEEIQEIIGTVPRRVYNPSQVEEDARAIAEAYEVRGRLAASVNPRIIRRPDNQVDVVFEVAEGGVVEIERISFVGNRAFSDRRLRRALATKQAGLLRQFIGRDTFVADREQLDRQLLTDFYRSRGYVDFRIEGVSNEFSRDRDAFFVQYNIEEGPRWSFGNVTASSSVPGVDAQDYARLARIRPGQTYSPAAIDEAVARMERLATQRGLTFIRADPRDHPGQPQPASQPQLQHRARPAGLRRADRHRGQRDHARPGDPARVRDRRGRPVQSARNPRFGGAHPRAGYFSNVEVEAREGTTGDQVIVDVNVEEQPTGSLTFGASYSTDTGAGVNVGLTERNFLGRGQFLQFERDGRDRVPTAPPSPSASRTSSDATCPARSSSSTTRPITTEATYNTSSAGFSPSLAFPVSLNGRLSVRYLYSDDDLSDINVLSSPILRSEEGRAVTSAVGYTYSYDTRRTGIDPTQGILLRFGQDFAGVGGDVKYVETRAEATYQKDGLERGGDAQRDDRGRGDQFLRRLHDARHRPLLSLRRASSGASSRWASDRGTSPRRTMMRSAATTTSRRGSRRTSRSACRRNTASAAACSLDAGSIWGLDDTSGFDGVEVDDSFHLRSSIGVSLFWITPFGPLRFNYAEPIQQEDYDRPRKFNVTVSTEF